MNVLYCGDAGMCQGIFLSALSVCKHTDTTLHIYILTAAIPPREAIRPSFARQLQAALNERHDCNVTLTDVTERFLACPPTANMQTRFTPLCTLRLFADLVSEIPDKILYLDADVLCRGDLTSLYALPMNDAEIAGVPDRYGKWFFGNIFRHDYLNSGVLLMNVARIRQSGVLEKCRILCRDKKMFMPDQTALNKLAKKKKLPVKYNEQGKIKRNTVLKHFTTFFRFFPYFRPVTVKPWQPDELHKRLKIFEFDDILYEYTRRTQP